MGYRMVLECWMKVTYTNSETRKLSSFSLLIFQFWHVMKLFHISYEECLLSHSLTSSVGIVSSISKLVDVWFQCVFFSTQQFQFFFILSFDRAKQRGGSMMTSKHIELWSFLYLVSVPFMLHSSFIWMRNLISIKKLIQHPYCVCVCGACSTRFEFIYTSAATR